MTVHGVRNPTWTRDELILALDLYQDFPSPDQTHSSVIALSRLLNRIWLGRGAGSETLRNANGVSMKLANFQRLDPAFLATGRKGLDRGGKLEKEIWADFSGDRSRLSATAAAIRNAVGTYSIFSVGFDSEDGVEASEGAVLTRLHRFRERDRAIVARKKAQVTNARGHIACEACRFDYRETYGVHGAGFIEVHHLRPLSTLAPDDKTRLADLAAVCANCHRMIHARRPWLSIEELRALLRTGGNA